MRCPQCGCIEDKVVESRASRENDAIRRRRECLNCQHRYTTYETVVRPEKMVIKRDGSREEFNPEKLCSGIRKACWKRPIGEKQIEGIVRKVETHLEALPEKEVKSSLLGKLVMEELHDVDEVAYVRFASVYRSFKDVEEFINEIRNLAERPK